MIWLATDFGIAGPYAGQMKARLARDAPGVPVIDLFADLPAFQPETSAYLLAAYAGVLAPGDILLAVVDPGVGSRRLPLMLHLDGRWMVGPDNGLFELIRRRARCCETFAITWTPGSLSPSFHGRDLFAPVAARLASGLAVQGEPVLPADHADWPDDLPAIVYVDHYGNAMTGLRAAALQASTALGVAGTRLERAHTFADRPAGSAFWYENANGLAEIAINRGSAAERFGLRPGDRVTVLARR